MSPRSRARRLIPRYLAGQASAEEVREVEMLLTQHHNCADLFADCTGLELGLEALFREADAIFSEVSNLATPRQRRPGPGLGGVVSGLAVACLVLGLIVLLAFQKQ